MISSTDLKILKDLGEGTLIANIIKSKFNSENEFYDWWNRLAKSNHSKRTEILLNNCEGFQLERKDHGIPKIKSADDKNLFFGGVNAVSRNDAVGDHRRGGHGITC